MNGPDDLGSGIAMYGAPPLTPWDNVKPIEGPPAVAALANSVPFDLSQPMDAAQIERQLKARKKYLEKELATLEGPVRKLRAELVQVQAMLRDPNKSGYPTDVATLLRAFFNDQETPAGYGEPRKPMDETLKSRISAFAHDLAARVRAETVLP